ncbi:MAG: hypothetical protein GY943_11980, partial [Chloroflexi bacterium]|nr:hypothetical protein [Chloroflexota bacterium]
MMKSPHINQKHDRNNHDRLNHYGQYAKLGATVFVAILGIGLLILYLQPNSVQADIQSDGQAVIFSNNSTATTLDWAPTEISAQVPVDSINGSVFVSATHGTSNVVSFTLGTSSVPNASGQATTWATEWSGGLINVDTVWDDDILLTGDVLVDASATLTINPGVTVFFAAGSDDQASGEWVDKAELRIEGGLVADGTPGAPIYFVSNAASPAVGDWGQVSLHKDGSFSFSHCMIRHAERGIFFVSIKEGTGVLTGTVQNCMLSDNRIGLELEGRLGVPLGGTLTTNLIITNNYFKNNIDHGVMIKEFAGTGNVVGSTLVQNNVIEGSQYGVI